MDTDRNLLFAVLTLRFGLIDAAQLAEACTAWAARKSIPLADLLVERGWITPADRAALECLLELKLRQQAGDVRASLAEAADAKVRRALAALEDPDIRDSVTQLPPPPDPASVPAALPPAGAQERYTLTRLHA